MYKTTHYSLTTQLNLKVHKSAIFYDEYYRFFKEGKTDLLTSIVTGKTTVTALEISLVNSG